MSSNNPTSPRRSQPTPVFYSQTSIPPASPAVNNVRSPRKSKVRSYSQPKSAILSKPLTHPNFTVHDIGGSSLPKILSSMLHSNLITPDANGKRLLSSPLLSDEAGLKMWSDITHLPNYYQTRDEIELLTRCGTEIIQSLMLPHSPQSKGLMVLDLGAGDIRKVLPLLRLLSTANIPTTYYALDLSSEILHASMSHLRSLNLPNLTCHGLWGTFDSALSWVKSLPSSPETSSSRLFLSLGSSFGNDFFEPAVERLKEWRAVMRGCDRMLLGMDGTVCKEDIWESYHPVPISCQEKDIFEKFMRNGLQASNTILKHGWYKPEDWEVKGVLTTEPYIMHRFVFTAKKEVRCPALGLVIKKGEEIDCYEAFKYGAEEMRVQFQASGLFEIECWSSESGRINQFLLA